MIKNPITYKFFKNFTNHRRKTNRTVVFNRAPFTNILKYRDPDETFQQSGIQYSLRWIVKVQLVFMKIQVHSSFWSTTGIHLGSDAFDKSRLVMTLLTNLGVIKMLCNFWLILEGKAGKEIPGSRRSEFLKTFLEVNFALSYAEKSTSVSLNSGDSRFTFVEITI